MIRLIKSTLCGGVGSTMIDDMLKFIMRKKSTLIFLAFILIVAGVIIYTRPFENLAGLCGNEILEVSSPNDSADDLVKSVVFVRNCGATTDWSVQVSILSANEELDDNDIGNVFVASSGDARTFNRIGGPEVKTIWKDNSNLEIQYSRGSEIFLQATQYGGNDITYTSF